MPASRRGRAAYMRKLFPTEARGLVTFFSMGESHLGGSRRVAREARDSLARSHMRRRHRKRTRKSIGEEVSEAGGRWQAELVVVAERVSSAVPAAAGAGAGLGWVMVVGLRSRSMCRASGPWPPADRGPAFFIAVPLPCPSFIAPCDCCAERGFIPLHGSIILSRAVSQIDSHAETTAQSAAAR